MIVNGLKITIEDGESIKGRLPEKVVKISGQVGDKPIAMEIEDELIEGGKGTRRIEPGIHFEFWIRTTDKTITIREAE